jgi:cytochrome c peroxidase
MRHAPRSHRIALAGVTTLTAAIAAGVGDAPVAPAHAAASDTTWRWVLPAGFPTPLVPADNPMSVAKVELGRRLFHDPRLSRTGTMSCAGCHVQARAFTDARPRAIGVTGQVHPRGSMSLANVAYQPVLTWANPTMRRLEAQALVPIFGEHPEEMAMAGREATLLERLRDEPRYAAWFRSAFPADTQPVTIARLADALAAFQRTLVSGDSPFDRARRGERGAMSALAREGERLFFSERTECFHCHGGFAFTNTVTWQGKGFADVEFHNTGLYAVGARRGYPRDNPGLAEFTGDDADDGKFKAPTLRNVAVTAPYMHDGSIATLDAVVAHYARGGRRVATGPHASDGARNPRKSGFVKGFTLTPRERRALVAFLEALTDSAFLVDPRFGDPWAREAAVRSTTGGR